MKTLFDANWVRRCLQHRRGCNLFFFLAGIVLTGLYVSPPLVGGFFREERLTFFAEFVLLIALFGFLSFRKPIVRRALTDATVPEALLAFVLSALGSVWVSLRFFRAFFAPILRGEQTPLRLWLLVRDLPRALVSTGLYLFSALCLLATLFALFFLALYAVRLFRGAVVYTLRHPDLEPPAAPPSLAKRCWIGALLALVTSLLCFFTLNNGQDWGADYSLYMRYGIQIAQSGTAQTRVPWGFPLLLAPVYQIVGYDTQTFSSLIYYKIPGALCMTLLTFALFLFYSKRFPLKWAAVLTACIGFNPEFISFTNNILTNIPYLLIVVLSLLSVNAFFSSEKPLPQIAFAVLTGLSFAAANLVRSDGILLLFAFGCLHLVCLLCLAFRKQSFVRNLTLYYPLRRVYLHLLPYLTYLVATQVAYLLLSAPVLASNQAANAAKHLVVPFFSGAAYNLPLLGGFLQSLLPFGVFPELVVCILLPLLLIGIVRCFRRDLYAVIVFFGVLLFYILLQLRQGIRYLYPLLPLLILFLGAGVQALVSAHADNAPKRSFAARALPVVALISIAGLLFGSVQGVVSNLQNGRQLNFESFSEDAKAVYRVIQADTEEDSVILFYKSGVVSLNTGRAGMETGGLPQDVQHPFYLLLSKEQTPEDQLIPDEYPTIAALERAKNVTLTLFYENDSFLLYSVQPNAK